MTPCPLPVAPQGDRPLSRASGGVGGRAISVGGTGLGDEGPAGVRDISERGGVVLVEGQETAVVLGMPLAAQRTGVRHQSLGIWNLGDMLAELARPTGK